MSETKKKQGGSDEDAPRCSLHPGFVLGRCSLCGAKEEEAEGGAPAVADKVTGRSGHGTMAASFRWRRQDELAFPVKFSNLL